MRVIQAGYRIIRPQMEGTAARDAIYQLIEEAGRTCYKSEEQITPESAAKFVKMVVDRHHEAMLEHAHMTVRFIVDRGISHEIVRHRLASFAQESTRYCNYSRDKFGNEITVIEPCFFEDIPDAKKAGIMDFLDGVIKELPMEMTNHDRAFAEWYVACEHAESAYFSMLDEGCTPQEARAVLPNSLKTEVVMTANMREWRHFFRLRAAEETGKPHPQMLEVAVPLLKEVRAYMPELFGDILTPEEVGQKPKACDTVDFVSDYLDDDLK